MSEVIDITFEKVNCINFINWFYDVLKVSKLNSFRLGENLMKEEEYFGLKPNELFTILNESIDTSYNFVFDTFHISKENFTKVQIFVLKYDGAYDIEFSFLEDQIKSFSLSIVMDYVSRLALQFQSNNYYCGLEPAYDENTRFFTNLKNGPLEWKN